MRERLALSIIFLLALFTLVPSWFSEGAYFDATLDVVNECGETVTIHGIYFDNAYFFLVYLLASYSSIVVPLMCNLHISISIISFFIGGWFFAGLIGEIINLQTPLLVTNTAYDMGTFNRFLLCFVLGTISIIAFTTWRKTSK